MNITTALLLLAAAPEAPPETVATQDIIVLSKKLAAVRFKWSANDDSGAWRLTYCTIERSSGDKEVDAITCRATEECLPLIEKIRRQRRALFDACLTSTRRRMITELFDGRALAMGEAEPQVETTR